MNGFDQARTLLLEARKNLKVATVLSEAFKPKPEAIGFHFQQATEKALLAWLAFREVACPEIHDLNLLLSTLEGAGEVVSPFFSTEILNPFALQFRHAIYDESSFLWTEVQEHVTRLIEHVEALLFLGE